MSNVDTTMRPEIVEDRENAPIRIIQQDMQSLGYKKAIMLSEESEDECYQKAADILWSNNKDIISREEILRRLKERGNIVICPEMINNGVSGQQFISSGNTFLAKYDKDDRYRVNVMIHEMIHKLKNSKLGIESSNEHHANIQGFDEGATESMASGAILGKGDFYAKKKKYNLPPNTVYPHRVSIIRQMDYLLEDKTLLRKYTLDGDLTFLYEFGREYGEDLLLRLKDDTNAMDNRKQKNRARKFNDVQNDLLQKAFDKKFEQVKDKEGAKKYLESLKNFKSVRVNDDKDATFEDYYNEKLSVLEKHFGEKLGERLEYSSKSIISKISEKINRVKDGVGNFFAGLISGGPQPLALASPSVDTSRIYNEEELAFKNSSRVNEGVLEQIKLVEAQARENMRSGKIKAQEKMQIAQNQKQDIEDEMDHFPSH